MLKAGCVLLPCAYKGAAFIVAINVAMRLMPVQVDYLRLLGVQKKTTEK